MKNLRGKKDEKEEGGVEGKEEKKGEDVEVKDEKAAEKRED